MKKRAISEKAVFKAILRSRARELPLISRPLGFTQFFGRRRLARQLAQSGSPKQRREALRELVSKERVARAERAQKRLGVPKNVAEARAARLKTIQEPGTQPWKVHPALAVGGLGAAAGAGALGAAYLAKKKNTPSQEAENYYKLSAGKGLGVSSWLSRKVQKITSPSIDEAVRKFKAAAPDTAAEVLKRVESKSKLIKYLHAAGYLGVAGAGTYGGYKLAPKIQKQLNPKTAAAAAKTPGALAKLWAKKPKWVVPFGAGVGTGALGAGIYYGAKQQSPEEKQRISEDAQRISAIPVPPGYMY